jgi:hypothetical protein
LTVLFDGDISDAGAADLVGGSNIFFVTVHLTALGPLVSIPWSSDTDHILRAGFFSLGDHFDIGDSDVHDWWRAPIWIDFSDTLWTPLPTTDSSGPLTVVATRVRWSLSVGTTGHLHVFGS